MLFGPVDNELKEPKVMDLSRVLSKSMIEKLDDQALHAIETVVLLEYARCNKMSGDAVIKAFDGRRFVNISNQDKEIADAIRLIKLGVDNGE